MLLASGKQQCAARYGAAAHTPVMRLLSAVALLAAVPNAAGTSLEQAAAMAEAVLARSTAAPSGCSGLSGLSISQSARHCIRSKRSCQCVPSAATAQVDDGICTSATSAGNSLPIKQALM